MEQIDEHLAQLFAMEIQTQARMAELSLGGLRLLQDESMRSADHYWYHVEAMVKSLTGIANILWTTSTKSDHKRRSRELLKLFGLENMVLPADFRTTRNALEHYDEHLDKWWKNSESKNLTDRNIGPRYMFGGNIEHARSFNVKTGELSVFGVCVNLYDTYSFVQQVSARISKWHRYE